MCSLAEGHRPWHLSFKSPGLFFATRRAVFPTRRAVNLSRRVVKAWWVKHSQGRQKGDNLRSTRAYIRNLFPEKSVHPFTDPTFLVATQTFRVWRLGGSKPSQGVTACTVGRWMLWILENPSLHTWNDWISGEKWPCVKGWILFSGFNYVYREP